MSYYFHVNLSCFHINIYIGVRTYEVVAFWLALFISQFVRLLIIINGHAYLQPARSSLLSPLRPPCPGLFLPFLASFFTFQHQLQQDIMLDLISNVWPVKYMGFITIWFWGSVDQKDIWRPYFVVPCMQTWAPRVLGNVKLTSMGKVDMFSTGSLQVES